MGLRKNGNLENLVRTSLTVLFDRQLEVAELLLKEGCRLEAEDNRRSQPMHLAAAAGQHEMMELLLDYGASLSARDSKGITPLHVAAASGHLLCVEVCLFEDAKLCNATDYNGATPFHWAIQGGHEKA